jgi:outer membrane lipopolysaccharide assembly protein LptE/RlpB
MARAHPAKALMAAALLAASLFTASCGYSLVGRGTFLPAYIQTIGVPTFTNGTTFFEVEQILTERVRSEFIGRGKYRVLPETAGVDAVLTCEITSISIVPASFTDQQQASRYVFTMTARILFRDLKADTTIWENPSLVFREEYELASGSGIDAIDASVFFGQESNAVERIANDFAKTVVSAILEAF